MTTAKNEKKLFLYNFIPVEYRHLINTYCLSMVNDSSPPFKVIPIPQPSVSKYRMFKEWDSMFAIISDLSLANKELTPV